MLRIFDSFKMPNGCLIGVLIGARAAIVAMQNHLKLELYSSGRDFTGKTGGTELVFQESPVVSEFAVGDWRGEDRWDAGRVYGKGFRCYDQVGAAVVQGQRGRVLMPNARSWLVR